MKRSQISGLVGTARALALQRGIAFAELSEEQWVKPAQNPGGNRNWGMGLSGVVRYLNWQIRTQIQFMFSK